MFILVVVNGVAGGLVASLEKNFADLVAGHVFFLQVEKGEKDKIFTITRDDKGFLDALDKSGLKYTAVTRRTTALGQVIFSGDSVNRNISGVNWNEEKNLPDSLKLVAGDAHSMAGTDGIVISTTLAESVGLVPKKKLTYAETAVLRRDIKIRWKSEGKKFDLEKEVKSEVARQEAERKQLQLDMLPKIIGETLIVKLDTIYGQKNVAEFRVAGLYETQMDYSAYVDRDVLNSYIEMPVGSYNLCGVMLKDFSNLDQKTVLINSLLKGKYDLVPYTKISGRGVDTVISELKKEKFDGQKTIVSNLNNELGSIVAILTGVQAGTFGLFIVILLVVMVGLVNTFRIVIYERTKEIGTMRAVGTQKKQVRNLFLLEATFLGVIGTIPGTVLGFIVLNVIKLFRFDSISELGLFLDNGHIGYSVSIGTLVFSILLVIGFTLIAALLPSRRAAKMEPAQALRSQF
jgi:putative ABC transport system permease protein